MANDEPLSGNEHVLISSDFVSEGELHDLERRQHESRIMALAPAITRALAAAAWTFEKYAEIHGAKGTPEGDEKAQANLNNAKPYRRLLALIKGGNNGGS